MLPEADVLILQEHRERISCLRGHARDDEKRDRENNDRNQQAKIQKLMTMYTEQINAADNISNENTVLYAADINFFKSQWI